jgi:ATP-dependent 26S proteasome regulatory subunit
MNKKNGKQRNNTSRFKSYIDINNYNNFIIELDKLNQKNKSTYIPSTNIPSTNIPSTNISSDLDSFGKTNIQTTVQNINDDYDKNYKDKNFSGVSALDVLLAVVESTLDPNQYINNVYESFPKNSPKKIYKNHININVEIQNINDLLNIISKYPDDSNIEYNINLTSLHKIKEPLTQLNNMIGMKNLKENIVDQILFYIQNLHTLKSNIQGNDFMHTVIYGPPGTGKTEIAKIIGSIFSKMGVLTKGSFRKVTRADLIAGYLGQTALKTRDVIKDCLGGVLFIDEAYALGNQEKRDSFSKECIDTLCEALSDHKDNLMVIIAGYETDLNDCFFNYNQGLSSRFTWRFKTEEYTAEHLFQIFIKKVNDSEWFLKEDSNIDVKWFEKNKSHFKFYGRDIETLFAKTKIAHSRRVFCLDISVKKHLTLGDLDKGLEIYIKNEDNKKKDDEKFNKIISSMYI